MQGMSQGDESCPFAFNFDPSTFKAGDVVSYRVTGSLADFPFVGTLVEVHDDHVAISVEEPGKVRRIRGTRESRPVVEEADAVG